MKRALLLVALLLLSASCGMHTPTEPASGAGTGMLVVKVVDLTTHAGLPNATVEIHRGPDGGEVILTGVTNASGVFQTSLPAGGYSVQIVPPDGYALRAINGPTAAFMLAEGSTVTMNAFLVKF